MTQSPTEANTLLQSKFRIRCSSSEDGGDATEPPAAETPEATPRRRQAQSEGDSAEAPEAVDLSAQLDQERAARIQLQRERDDAAERALQLARESEEEGDRVAAERDDFKKKYEKLKGLMETSFLENAILKNSKYQFHDPADVRTFLNPKNIRLDLDTGEVEGLEAELKRIAKDKPYLVINNENAGGESDFTPPPGPGTGNHPYGGSVRQRETDRNKLGSKYRLPGFMTASSKPV